MEKHVLNIVLKIAWIYTAMTLNSLVLCNSTITEACLDNEHHRRETADKNI